MKKILMLGASLAICLSIQAQTDMSLMVFKLKDGTTQSLRSQNLSMNISDGKLIAGNDTQSLEIPMASLQEFCFSSDAGISSITDDAPTGPIKVYSIDGKFIGAFSTLDEGKDALSAGIYVVKSNASNFKIEVK